jgi:flagellar motor component MotA
MKKLIIMICLTTTIGMANPKSVNAVAVEQVAIAHQKQEGHLEYNECVRTYYSIKYLLDTGVINLEEAQKLWLQHKIDE